MVAPLLVEAGLTTKYYLETRWQWLMKVIAMLRERCKLVTDFVELSRYFFEDPPGYDEKGAKKSFNLESANYLTRLADRYELLDELTEPNAEAQLRALVDELEVGAGKVIHPTRLAVSGLTGGPSLFAMLEALGKERVLKRLRDAVKYIEGMER
jgi:glutamyl-tRNA synthetase